MSFGFSLPQRKTQNIRVAITWDIQAGSKGVLDLISRSWNGDKLVILECAGFSSEDTERWVELLKSKLRHLNEMNFFIIETQPEYDFHCKNMNIQWYESKKKGLLWIRETLNMQNAEPPT